MIDRNENFSIAGGVVAIGLMAILGFMTWALVFITVPPSNQNALTVLIGILSANVGMVVGFYFGTSVGNRKQAEAISTLATTAKAAQDTLSATTATPVATLAPGETVSVKAEDKP